MSAIRDSAKKTSVLIVDDHPMTRHGLAHLINHEPDLIVCCEAQNAAEALEGIAQTKPDLVLADITLPDKIGLELIKDIKAISPDVLILMISMHDEKLYAKRVLRAGARGYVSKDEGGEKMLQAIRRVLGGEIYVSEKMSAQILELFSGGGLAPERSGTEQLSDREFEVFQLLGQGLSAHEIGERLHLSAKTVDAHRANIKQKLNLKTSAELISYAARWMAQQDAGEQ